VEAPAVDEDGVSRLRPHGDLSAAGGIDLRVGAPVEERIPEPQAAAGVRGLQHPDEGHRAVAPRFLVVGEPFEVEVHHPAFARDLASRGKDVDAGAAEARPAPDLASEQALQQRERPRGNARDDRLDQRIRRGGAPEVLLGPAGLEMRVECAAQRELLAAEVGGPLVPRGQHAGRETARLLGG
jgi:hypothetical protein